jgi:hypothetical protein
MPLLHPNNLDLAVIHALGFVIHFLISYLLSMPLLLLFIQTSLILLSSMSKLLLFISTILISYLLSMLLLFILSP